MANKTTATQKAMTQKQFVEEIKSESIGSRKACELAQTWKQYSASAHSSICKKLGKEFTIAIAGSASSFVFSADGSVRTVNANRRPAAASAVGLIGRASLPKPEEGRNVVGMVKGRYIYA